MLYGAPMETGLLRIGELSRRSGVSPELLRAWERRYQLLRPTRSVGGLRLYSADDLERVRAMQQHLAEGFAAAEAAALATSTRTEAKEVALAPDDVRRLLDEALTAFDDARAQAIFDSLLATATLDTAISAVVVPYLHELGERWERGEVTVGQEHFASSVLRGRLLGLARGWGRGVGPRLVLACAPGEQHDLGLISFGLALRARGWRVVYLGADTPLASVADAANASDAVFVVISAVNAERFGPYVAELREFAQSHRLCLAGAGAAEADIGAEVVKLSGDPVEEAERLTTLASRRWE
jgi:MerR family transcriptional regulator, light-induced transcriptional regulator